MLIVVLHDVYSTVKLSEVVDVVMEFDEVDLFVVSKAVSSAAQSGVPEAEKKMFSRGRRILFIPDITDLKELIPMDRIFFFVPRSIAKDVFDPAYIRKLVRESTVALVFSGGESSFSKRELSLGESLTLGFKNVMPPSAEISIVLYTLFPRS